MTGEVQIRERLSKDPAPTLVARIAAPKLRREFAVLFQPQLEIHFAHCLMLLERGIIAREDGAAILRALLDLHDRGVDALAPNHALEDLYSHVEHDLVARLGPDVGGRLHTARSRNDLGVTQWRMVLRACPKRSLGGRLLDVRAALLGLRAAVLDLADAHVTTVMPGYTHSQHAQPITLGYYLAAFADVLARDARRLAAAYATANCSPLGAAALTTTGFPIDREATMRRLGFAALVENAFDAVASRDDAEEAAGALALLGVHLARVAEDFFVWGTAEFALIEFGDEYASVSSIMPQKKNPGFLEYIKKASGHLIGHATQVLAAAKGAWFTDAADATDAGNEPLLEATATAVACLEVLAGSLATVTVYPERMLHLARVGYGTMTELADTIVREAGVSFRVAHNIVGRTVARAVAAGQRADELTHAMLDATARELFGRPLDVSEAAIARALDPAENIRARTVRGGPAPGELRRMLAEARRLLARDREDLERERERVAASRAALLAEARAVAAEKEGRER
ncbi:MAG TPA: argininosuccinate lyase [Thermomicrobiales bacterium]|nr:argininosuccinate lyase [Thermomicrobiales bacterium]